MAMSAGKGKPRLKADPWTPPTRSQTQEALLHLYLRLNGYLTTGFIVHSPEHGKNITEVDAVAVRHPHNAEPTRVIGASMFLDPSDSLVDLLICEVKTNRAALTFNKPLRDDFQALETVLRWVGLFEPALLGNVVVGLQQIIHEGCRLDEARTGIVQGNVRVRALLCAPSLERSSDDEPWFLPGSVILAYVHECLTRPRPAMSSVRYNFGGWGPWLEPIVRYFKALGPNNAPVLEELYEFSGAAPV